MAGNGHQRVHEMSLSSSNFPTSFFGGFVVVGPETLRAMDRLIHVPRVELCGRYALRMQHRMGVILILCHGCLVRVFLNPTTEHVALRNMYVVPQH